MATSLALLSETEFENRAPDGFPVSCPTLNLSITLANGGKHAFIQSPPGKIVSKIVQLAPPGSPAPEVKAVAWKADGQFLALGWSDGVLRLMGLESNKAVHHIDICPQQGNVEIAHIGWAISNITTRPSQSLPKNLQNKASEILGDLGGSKVADLPRELTFLEVETALPKISPLPTASAETSGNKEDATIFTLRSNIDFLFQAPKAEEYDKVNVLIVGSTDGQIHLSIYDSFVIGSFPAPSLGLQTISQLIRVASSPQLSTHALLLADKPTQPEELHLLPMDLPFISSVPINLSLLASKLTTLQKLLRYLRQTQFHMQFEWKNSRELPGRFLQSVRMGLEETEKGPRDVVSAFFHVALTGHMHEHFKEWLSDSLGERGHKRWDKAVVSGLQSLRSLVHENFLPALKRCSIILSRLRGLAQFHDAREDIGFTVTQISKVMDIVECLTLLGNKILVIVMDELDHFSSFSAWLRFQIDKTHSSFTTMELTEKEATVDVGKVLNYIEHYLVNSSLRIYFDEMDKAAHEHDWAQVQDVPRLLDILDAQLKKYDAGQESMSAIPRVEFHMDLASHWVDTILRNIAEAKKRSVRLGKPVKLDLGGKIDNYDLRICNKGSTQATVYAALSSKDANNQVSLFRVNLEITNGISSNRSIESCSIDMGDHTLIDLKFMGDRSLVLLYNTNDNTPAVIWISIDSEALKFSPLDESNLGSGESIPLTAFKAYDFPCDKPLKPIRMEAHEAADVRGEIPARICLLGANRTTWQIFTLPEESLH